MLQAIVPAVEVAGLMMRAGNRASYKRKALSQLFETDSCVARNTLAVLAKEAKPKEQLELWVFLFPIHLCGPD